MQEDYKKLEEVMSGHKNDWDFKISHRKEFNEMIIEQLKLLIDKWPQLRFWQLMCALGYETNPDRFYEESYDTYEQIKIVSEGL